MAKQTEATRRFQISVEAPELSAAIEAEIQHGLDMIEQGWGFRPDVELRIEGMLRVSIGFNLKGFAHAGQSIHVRPGNLKRLSPRTIAKRLLGELVLHRNTCERCGVLVPTLHQRVSQHEYPCRDPHLAVIKADGKLTSRRARPDELYKFDLPADEVERSLFPQISKRLDKLLGAKATAALAESQRQVDAFVGSGI